MSVKISDLDPVVGSLEGNAKLEVERTVAPSGDGWQSTVTQIREGTTKANVGLGNVTNDVQLKIASNLSDLNNAALARANLGLEIGVSVQAWSANLDQWAMVVPTDYYTAAEVDAGFQPLDADLTAIAAADNGAVLAATTASFLIADAIKLDGIEAGAEVNDADTVLAAAAITDNRVVRGDGGARGVQQSGLFIDDSDRIGGFGNTVWQTATEAGGEITFDTNLGLLLNWRVTVAATAEVQIPANLPDGRTAYLELDPNGQTVTWAAGYRADVPDPTNKALVTIIRSNTEYIASVAHEEASP